MERLQKILAHAGIASRRKCEELVLAKRVRVNGALVTELGTQVDPENDRIEVDGKIVHVERKAYVLLHKPRGYLSDLDSPDSPSKKPFAMELVPTKERLYAAGRLDANSEGLLFLTNDGDLAHIITHPRYQHDKEYLALVDGVPSHETLDRLHKGVLYEGERLRADSVETVSHLGAMGREHHWDEAQRGETWLRIILHEGKKREIRHLCNAVGHPVKRLIRVRIGPIELGTLHVGKWRALSQSEVDKLKSFTTQKEKQRDDSQHHKTSIHHRDRRTRGIGQEHGGRTRR
jgi:23S rRNA pseudouridine2605 synthase